MDIHLEEFLYRGRPAGSDQPVGWHVVLAAKGRDAFGNPEIKTSGALTPEQAEAMGFPLPTVLAAINKEIMAEHDALAVAVAGLSTYSSAWEDNAALDRAEAERLRSENALLKDRIAELQPVAPEAQEAA